MDEATGTLPSGRYSDHQGDVMDDFFRSLNEKERAHVYRFLSEIYAVSYYETLDGFSHAEEVAHLKNESRKNLHKLQNSRTHHAILFKAGSKKRHVLRYIAHWSEKGKEAAHTRNLTEGRYDLRAQDVLHIYEETVHPVVSVARKSIGLAKKVLASDNLGKVFFVSLLFLIAFAVIATSVGAYQYPHIPVFKKVRSLFEC